MRVVLSSFHELDQSLDNNGLANESLQLEEATVLALAIQKNR